MLGCYRCAHIWRSRRPESVKICPRCKSRSWNVPKLAAVIAGHGLGIAEVVGPHRDEVIFAASARGFRHIRVFGSVRRREATRTSDVDLLVDRDESASLLDRAALSNELEGILHRRVDVVPEESLHWLIRPQILFEAVPL
jgi:uncharacterized protein